MKTRQQIVTFIDKLIAEGVEVLDSQWQPQGNYISGRPTYVDLEKYTAWRARCRLLSQHLGSVGKPWQDHFEANWSIDHANAVATQGLLKAVKQSADEGLLFKIEELVWAEAFSNLLEQSEYLLKQGYFLAAGVLLRAVLEEKLRALCAEKGIRFTKQNPTLNDYNTELYRVTVYDKLTFKELDALIAIGNDAAHNAPTLKFENIERLYEGVARSLQNL